MPYEKTNKGIRCIADEIPFEIPDSWEWARCGEIFQHNTGKALNSSNRSGRLLKYITTSNLYWDRFELENLKKMFFSDTEIEKCTVCKGDLLVCEGGDFGRAAIWNFDMSIRIQNHIHRLRSYSSINTRFFYYLFYFYKNAGLIGGKGIGIQGLSSNALHALLFPVPPLAEQQRIVAKIEELLPHIEEYDRVEQKLDKLNTEFPEQLKKSILQWAIQGKLLPQNPDDEPASVLLDRIRAEKAKLVKAGKIKKDKVESVIFRRDNSHYTVQDGKEVCLDDKLPFEIPVSWSWVKLKELLEQASTGPFGSMLHKSDYVDSGVPLVNPANIVGTQISDVGIKKVSVKTADKLRSYKLFPGDVIIGRRGELGRSAVVPDNAAGWLCGTGCFFVTANATLLPAYLVFLLASPYIREALLEKAVGTTMNNLNHGILGDLLVPLPPKQEQHRILMQWDVLIKRFFA